MAKIKKMVAEGVYFYRMEALNCDYYGNPRALVSAMDENGKTIFMDGKAYGYNMSAYYAPYLTSPETDENGEYLRNKDGAILQTQFYSLPPKSARVEYHRTRTGNIIVDSIRDFEDSKKEKLYY